MLNIKDFGAIGDGAYMNTEAFRRAMDAAKPSKETVLVPAGTFLTGTINLDGVSLYLESGAIIKTSPDLNGYPTRQECGTHA